MSYRDWLWPAILALGLAVPAGAQSGLFPGDAYTAYYLLEPGSASFRVIFYPSETEPGATLLLNGTRSGSKGSDILVYDPETGEPLKFEYLSGEELIADKTPGRFTAGEHYIRAHLSRPVPQGGEGRVLIEKTYWDPRTYYLEGEEIVYKRSLGVGRQSIVLPKGYSIVSSNVAGQVVALPDGRLQIAFANINGYAADVTIRARKTTAALGSNLKLAERGFDRGKTLYDLMAPDTHLMKVSLDYVEEQKGNRSRAAAVEGLTEVEATNLDTAKPLKVVREASATFVLLERPIEKERQSAHIELAGKLSDPKYRVEEGELLFERTLKGVRNTVLLPAGWELTALSTPGTVDTDGGRTCVRFVNGRPEDEMRVSLRARKQVSATSSGLLRFH